MESLAEHLVATYLTQGGKVFIAPQYSIPGPGGGGEWSCPDFVALDFEKREVVVVEITVAANVGPIIEKINDRQKRWFEPLRQKLESDKIVDGTWEMRLLCFVRRSQLQKAKASFSAQTGVAFFAIEDATFGWDYWTVRQNGLPR